MNRPASFHHAWVEEINRLSLAIFAESIRHPRELRWIPIRPISAEPHSIAKKSRNFFLCNRRAIEPSVQRLAATKNRECERRFFSKMQEQRRAQIAHVAAFCCQSSEQPRFFRRIARVEIKFDDQKPARSRITQSV